MAGPPSVDLAVEMAIHLAGGPKVLPFVADQDRIHNPGIQFQLHLEPTQSQVDLVEIIVDADGPVFAHHPIDAGIEETVQIQMRIQWTQERQGPGEAILRTFANTVMIPRVVDLLQPAGELAIKILERAGPLAWQTQAGFKILLQGPEHPLHLAAAPGLSRFGVDQADAEIGADDLEMIVNEWAAVVRV